MPACSGVLENVLQELAEEEDRAEHPEVHRQRDHVGDRESAVGEELHRQHRVLRAQLEADESEHEHRADGQRDHDLGVRPTQGLGADESVHDPEQTARGQHQSADVQPALRSMALGQPRRGQRDENGSDRDVDPEDPVP